ncbi:MAG TPA: family 16 glycosylhydrolase [Tepidisphaeraceae bacterium]|nr:family 16 glycosylhydrolase [Tepidisphaeraceae bacterium]
MASAPAQWKKRARSRWRGGRVIEWLEARLHLTGTGNLVFDDEFNQAVGTQPSTAVWSPYLPTDPNNGAVVYTNSTSTLSVVSDPQATDGRALAMTMIPQSNGTFDSSEISTQIDPIGDSLEYGEVSARIKLPSATGAAGIWPAFWMLGSDISTPENNNTTPWPLCGEIDIVENKGSTPGQAQGSLHAGSVSDQPDYNPTGVYNLAAGQAFSSAYHIFSINWTPTTISFAVDGNVYETQNISSSGVPSDDVGRFQHPFFIILDMCEGGSFAGGNNGTQYTVTSPTTMYVDYVRVSGYQITSNPNTLPQSPTFFDLDVNTPTLGGSSNFDGLAWIENGSGYGINAGTTTDQFNFASQTVSGNVTIVAEVNTISNTANSASAGIMIRDSTAPNGSYAYEFLTPSNNVSGEGASFNYRNGDGTAALNDSTVAGVSTPEWFELVRSGNTFTAYYSSNGSTWTQNGASETISMNSTVNVGLAVSSDTNSALNTAIFTHVSVLPAAWSDSDIGSPDAPGSASYNASSGQWTVGGGGADIFGTSDQFNLASTSLTGDGNVMAEVLQIGNSNAWAKAGVMFRNDTTAGSEYATIDVTPTSGVTFQWRSTTGGNVTSADAVTVGGVSTPYWVELSRTGNVFSAYYSPNGSSWTQIGSPETIAMNSTVLAGLAVTSHDNATLTQANFANVAVNSNVAVQTGGNLALNFSAAASTISASANGGSVLVNALGNAIQFNGVTSVTANFNPGSAGTLGLEGTLSGPLTFNGEGTADTINVANGEVTLPAAANGSGGQAITLGAIAVGTGAEFVLADADTPADQTSLSVNSLSLSDGTLDVGNNVLTVNYAAGSDPNAQIRSYLTTGYNGGAWNGMGIISSTVAAEDASQSKLDYAVGYADGADELANVPSGEIEIKPALAGDMKLQGTVNFGDFQILAQYFGQSGGWDEGNFNYGSAITFGDFQLLAQDFGQTASLNGGNAQGIAAASALGSSPGATVNQAAGSDITSAVLAGNSSPFSDQLLELEW